MGSNKIDLTKDTIYTHPNTKQCDYSVDLSNYITQDDIETLKKELSDMGAKVVGSVNCYDNGDNSTSKNITVPADYDYVEIYAYRTYADSYSSATENCDVITVANGGSGLLQLGGGFRVVNNTTYQTVSVVVSCTASTVSLSMGYAGSDGTTRSSFPCTIVFYKYDS